jgi:hypothetical protein
LSEFSTCRCCHFALSLGLQVCLHFFLRFPEFVLIEAKV